MGADAADKRRREEQNLPKGPKGRARGGPQIARAAKSRLEKTEKGRSFSWLELFFWLTVVVIWVLTAYHWLWLLAIAGRIWWWWRMGGQAKTQQVVEQRVPTEVQRQVSGINLPLLGWLGKLVVVLIGLLLALSIYPCLSALILIGGWWWLRRSPPPKKLNNGGYRLPNPYLRALLGYPIGFFKHNTIGGTDATNFGWRVGPFGRGEANLSGKISDFTIEVGLLDWLTGAAHIIVEDDGGDLDDTKIAMWASRDEVRRFILEAG